MAKTVLPLNDTQIKNAKPPKEGENYLADEQGLFLRLRASDTKQCIFD